MDISRCCWSAFDCFESGWSDWGRGQQQSSPLNESPIAENVTNLTQFPPPPARPPNPPNNKQNLHCNGDTKYAKKKFKAGKRGKGFMVDFYHRFPGETLSSGNGNRNWSVMGRLPKWALIDFNFVVTMPSRQGATKNFRAGDKKTHLLNKWPQPTKNCVPYIKICF